MVNITHKSSTLRIAVATGIVKVSHQNTIDAIQNSETTNININYNTISFNEDLSFPYSVPESYERIFIN